MEVRPVPKGRGTLMKKSRIRKQQSGTKLHIISLIFSHPDCNCRYRNCTGSSTRGGRGLYRRQGLSPCPEDYVLNYNHYTSVSRLCKKDLPVYQEQRGPKKGQGLQPAGNRLTAAPLWEYFEVVYHSTHLLSTVLLYAFSFTISTQSLCVYPIFLYCIPIKR